MGELVGISVLVGNSVATGGSVCSIGIFIKKLQADTAKGNKNSRKMLSVRFIKVLYRIVNFMSMSR